MDRKEMLWQQIDQNYEQLEALKKKTASRAPTDEERDQATKLMNQIEFLDVELRGIRTRERPLSSPMIDLDFGGYQSATGPFKKLGDQLQAIRSAGIEGNKIDSRLYEVQTRAATGMGETVPSDSGFLLQPDLSKEIIMSAFQVGQIAKLVRSMPIQSNGIKINAVAETQRATSRWGGLVSYWVAEAGSLTPSYPKIRQMELSLKKLCALVYCTDEVLADVSVLSSFVKEGLTYEFSFQMDESILNGSGVGQPLGIFNSASLIGVARQTTGTVTIQDLSTIFSRCLNQTNGTWVVNPTVLPILYQMAMTIGNAGMPVYLPPGGISSTPYTTIFGRPVVPSEHCQTLGVKGDILFGDFSQYLLVMKSAGALFDSSIHVRSPVQ